MNNRRYFTTGTIAVVKVGEEAVKHRVHKALLIQHSDYFCGALTGRFREAEEQSVTLDDVEPGVCESHIDPLFLIHILTSFT